MIAAVATGNFAIGRNGDLCFHISDDLKHFKELTMGHPIIMGSNTMRSIEIPLPGRRNMVLSRNPNLLTADDFEVYSSLEEALKACEQEDEVFIIGGGQVYKEAYPLADTLYLTEIFESPQGADTFFPPYHHDFKCVEREYHYSEGKYRFEFTKYVRYNT